MSGSKHCLGVSLEIGLNYVRNLRKGLIVVKSLYSFYNCLIPRSFPGIPILFDVIVAAETLYTVQSCNEVGR